MTSQATTTQRMPEAPSTLVEPSLSWLHSAARAIFEAAGTIDEFGDDRLLDTVRHAVDAATKKRDDTTYASSLAPPRSSD